MKQHAGFTLVELSIVLVILGLLIGGVLTGQSLIRAAELRSVSTQYSRYVTAVQTFRDKYFALPGDMTNAQSYWGVADSTAATCITTSSTDSKTCNGDGNGSIDASTGSNEKFRFWQHLANAGLIEGSYSGISNPAGTGTGMSTTNVPLGKISASGWVVYAKPNVTSATQEFLGTYGNVFLITQVATSPGYPVLKPEDADNIDTKLDDGKPGTGKVAIFATAGLSGCTNAASSSDYASDYLLNSTAVTCALYFRQAF